MASESALRGYLTRQVEAADPDIHIVQVENMVEIGTPDTFLRHGGVGVWLELKELEAPKRPTTGVRCPHYTRQQFAWAAKEWRAGGRCWMLLQLNRAYLLLHPLVAAGLRTGVRSTQQLRDAAVAVWDGTLPGQEFLNVVTTAEGV